MIRISRKQIEENKRYAILAFAVERLLNNPYAWGKSVVSIPHDDWIILRLVGASGE